MGPVPPAIRGMQESGLRSEGNSPAADIGEVATQFEALLLGQLLQSMQPPQSDEGSGDGIGATMLEFAQEHVARCISKNGGLGLAKLVAAGLSRREPAGSDPSVTPVSRQGERLPPRPLRLMP